jgi:hypothetical protein
MDRIPVSHLLVRVVATEKLLKIIAKKKTVGVGAVWLPSFLL